MKKMKEKKGITLIVLVVTIVIILILAGITAGMVTSDNGILKETKSAKIQAEIDNEKSIVERAKMLTMMRDKSGKVTMAVFEPALKDEAGTNPTEVSGAGDTIEVLFTDSNRYYEVDKDGNVSEPQEVVKDEYAGDITKGGRCDGSEEKPYEISCIEDLVAFSNMSNGMGIKLEDGKTVEITNGNNFDGKNIILTKNLNFKSKYSYDDCTRIDFGDLNDDGTIENIKTELTKTNDTCKGFYPISIHEDGFKGTFEGKNNCISGLYIKQSYESIQYYKYCGFIGVNSGIIKNFNIKNSKIEGYNIETGTICGRNAGVIYNCINRADVISNHSAGGIAGRGSGKFIQCGNYGNISSTGNNVRRNIWQRVYRYNGN